MSLLAALAQIVVLGTSPEAAALPALFDRLERHSAPMAHAAEAKHLLLTEFSTHLDPQLWSKATDYAHQWQNLTALQGEARQIWAMERWPDLPEPLDLTSLPEWEGAIERDWLNWQQLPAQSGGQIRVLPAAQALLQLSQAITAGEVEGLNSISQVFLDRSALNDRGLYLLAALGHAQITGHSTEGLPVRLTRHWMNRNSALSPAMAEDLQRIAAQAAAHQPPDLPQAAPQVAAAPTAITAPNIAFGLAGVHDWSSEMPFLDLMKTARPWTVHRGSTWAAMDHDGLRHGDHLDAQGWLRSLPDWATGTSTLVLTDLPLDTPGLGQPFVLSYEGAGEIRVSGRAQILSQEAGRIRFTTSGGEGGVLITLGPKIGPDPIRNIQILREDRLPLQAAGEVFNPDFLARLSGVRGLRFMDWMATNGATLARPEDRPQPSDYTWARHGVPIEVMVALANRLQADPWFTMPHLATPALNRLYAAHVAQALAPKLRAHVEYSNEVWNHGFAQSTWAEAEARKLWGQDWKWVQFYSLKAAEMAALWTEAFRTTPERLVRVISTQTGWLGLEADILNPPLLGRQAHWRNFDAYAVSGYFGGHLSGPDHVELLRDWTARAEAGARSAVVAEILEDLADARHSKAESGSLAHLNGTLLPYHAQVARNHGLELIMYEGGSHLAPPVALQNEPATVGLLTAANYTPEMGGLYRELLQAWQALTPAPFNAFVAVYAPTKYGAWGALRHLGDENPRWRALTAGE